MRDTLRIEGFAEALGRYMDAAHEEREAYKKYTDGGGWSWGYAGDDYIRRRTEAAILLEDALTAIIRREVNASGANFLPGSAGGRGDGEG
jgi:hypothetical protein